MALSHESSQTPPATSIETFARYHQGSRLHRVERSLYERAVGYNYEAVKIFMPANREKPVIVVQESP